MATNADLLTALRAAHFALAEAASHIRSREGHSAAYRRASTAYDAARNVLIKATPFSYRPPLPGGIEQDEETMRILADIADPNN